MMRSFRLALGATAALALLAATQEAKKPDPGKVSYDKKIRPILQAQCFGCHQPAKAKGGFIMTSFDKLLAGGETLGKAVVPGQPGKSSLLAQITTNDKGEIEMPKGKKPLDKEDVALITKWISEGALDDTPAGARAKFDMEHPPVYSRAPVVTSLDFSPDGQLLAVAGFHEALLYKADGSERVARLVGLSERIQSVRFSPDGKRLAVSGGLPGRSGEIQVWDLEKKTLTLSVPVTYETVYGASWSPDGSKIGFGCGDNTVRAIDAKTGEQVLFQGAHNDWALGTVFSVDGSHLASVSRDRTVKLIEVATQRFVDNISSITPGALKGGIGAVARHPKRDEIVIGGDDGHPRVYRMHRIVGRVIGDDSNIIREFPAIPGRVNAVAVSADGKRLLAAGGLDGRSEIAVYSYEFDTALPEKVKGAMGKVADSRSPAERKLIDDYKTEGVKVVAQVKVETGIVYAAAFRPDGAAFAAAGSDGIIRLYETETGKLSKEFPAAPVDARAAATGTAPVHRPSPEVKEEVLPAGGKLASLEVAPDKIALSNRFDYVQLVVTGRLETGEAVDMTRMVAPKLSAAVAAVSKTGLVQPKSDGQAALELSFAGKSVSVPVTVSGLKEEFRSDFIRDVNPVLSRVGCNAGTCHGSAQGKNGFKLSLRGYDSVADIRALTDELSSRRVNVASPQDSVMLLKTTAEVPHEGGQVLVPGEAYYEIVKTWIAQGARLDPAAPRVTKIEIAPSSPVLQRIAGRQQLRVFAAYADGRIRDVTRDAYIESSNTEIATTDRMGVVTAVRRGEAAVLARFEGAYSATPITVMGDRTGFAWEAPPAWNRIDELTAAKWERMKIRPSDLATDAEFLRRVHLDLTGLPPTADETRAFLADARETRVKRDEVVDKLIGSEGFIEHWTNKWADLLQVNRKFLGTEGAAAFRKWIRTEVEKNTPYDEFARKVITASGSNRENPPAAYYKILRDPASIAENTTHLFLGIRFNCTKCHDHPFERWTQNQYYETSAFFARVDLQKDPAAAGTIGGTAVEGAKPMYEIVADKKDGEINHLRTNQPAPPKFPFDCKYEAPKDATRRQELAAWISSADNAYFARSYVNRLWGYLFGTGIIEPIDDIRAGNPASNPQLLEHLTAEFLKSGFNPRHMLRLICTSRTYQLSVAVNPWNADDKVNCSHAAARRLPAEVLYDAVQRVTGSTSKIPGVAAGTRAAAIPDSGVDLPGGFLATFGRPVRESACECERNSDLRLGAVMALVSGPTLADAIGDPGNAITKLAETEKDDAKLVDEMFMRILNRPAKPQELKAALKMLPGVAEDNAKLAEILKDREAWWTGEKPVLEKRREESMARTQAELAAYEKEIAPQVEAEKKAQQEKIAKAEADLKAFDEALGTRVTEWEKKQSVSADWVPLAPVTLAATTGAKLAVEPDLSVTALDKNAKGTYTFTAETQLEGITAVRLEAIGDEKFPARGPGRAADGNFVLTELELRAASKAKPQEAAKVTLEKALASFSQVNFEVASAVDGNATSGSKGWAVSPATGTTHWATFEPKEPLGAKGGTILTFVFHFNFSSPEYALGRFRLSVSTMPRPVGLTLADEYRAAVATPAAQRSDKQKTALLRYQRAVDPEYRKRADAVAAAKAPLPVDPKLTEHKAAVERVTRPVPIDARLVQIRLDAEASAKQALNTRLTMAQDLAWALINSPAFLFNR